MILYEARRANARSQDSRRDPSDGGSARARGRATQRGDCVLRVQPGGDLSLAATSAGQRSRLTCAAITKRHGSTAPPHGEAGTATFSLDQREGPTPSWF